MRAWTREISESPPRLPRPGVERPITSSCSRVIVCPAAFPPVILRVSPAIWRPPYSRVRRKRKKVHIVARARRPRLLEAVDDAGRLDGSRREPAERRADHVAEDLL